MRHFYDANPAPNVPAMTVRAELQTDGDGTVVTLTQGDIPAESAGHEKLPETNPQITEIEFLTEQRSGQGTRFIEARSMDGRPFSAELELTECVDNSQARFVTDAGGTLWDTMFTFEETAAGGTRLEIKLDARPHRLLSKLMNPFVMGKLRSGMEEHIGSLEEYCESLESSP